MCSSPGVGNTSRRAWRYKPRLPVAPVRFSRGNTYENQTYCYHSIFDRAIALGALSFAWSAAAQSQTGSSTSLNAKDKMFVKKAAKGGMMEVAMGKLASERGQSADVKKFGERMVTDHSKANEDLTSIAEKKRRETTEQGAHRDLDIG